MSDNDHIVIDDTSPKGWSGPEAPRCWLRGRAGSAGQNPTDSPPAISLDSTGTEDSKMMMSGGGTAKWQD
jgi:hypothetical protein